MKKYIKYDIEQLEELAEDRMSLGVIFGEKLSIDEEIHDVVLVTSFPYSDVVSPDKVYFHNVVEKMFMYYSDFIYYLSEINHVNFTGNYELKLDDGFVDAVLFEVA